MDRITRNKLDHLVMKVTNQLTLMIEDSLKEIDGAGALSESNIVAICNRALRETSVADRILLHTEAWAEDVIAKATQIAAATVETKVRRAANRVIPRRGESPF